MALAICFAIIAFTGIVYGIVKKKRASIVISVIILILIAIIWKVYSYLYSLTPY